MGVDFALETAVPALMVQKDNCNFLTAGRCLDQYRCKKGYEFAVGVLRICSVFLSAVVESAAV